MRGRSYAGAGGMVSYLGTGDGNRTAKHKQNEFVHGTGFQNATMHNTVARNRNNPVFSSVQNSTSAVSSHHQTGGFTHLNVDMNVHDNNEPHATFPHIMNERQQQAASYHGQGAAVNQAQM